jgi:hypothetical protein
MAGIGDILGSTAGGAAGGAAAGPWGAIIGGGLGLLKGIFGGVQAAKGNKQLNTLMANRPQYNISQGYQDAFKTYQSLANSNLPGYDIMKGQIDQSGARAQSNLERGAMGSNQLMSGILSSQDKELDAIKNLGLMSAQWKGQQQQGLAQAQNQMGQLQDTQWQQNVLDPYNTKLNMAAGNKQAGMTNMFGGLQDAGSSLMNFAGTNSFMKVLQSMQGQGGGNTGQSFSQPFGGQFNSQQNLLNTLGGRAQVTGSPYDALQQQIAGAGYKPEG